MFRYPYVLTCLYAAKFVVLSSFQSLFQVKGLGLLVTVDTVYSLDYFTEIGDGHPKSDPEYRRG